MVSFSEGIAGKNENLDAANFVRFFKADGEHGDDDPRYCR